jgi:hypothetical protein
MAERRAQLRSNREGREQKYQTSRERAEREFETKLEDWERKTTEWRERVATLDRRKKTEVERVLHYIHFIAIIDILVFPV